MSPELILAAVETPTADAPVAADLAAPVPRTCSPFSTVVEAVLIFKSEGCGMVPVIDEGKPLGVVTDRDIALALLDHPDLGAIPVSQIMTGNFSVVNRETPFEQVVDAMGASGTQTLFVTSPDGLLEGVIRWPELARHLPIGLMAAAFQTSSSLKVKPQ